jgi:hypothetical protein
MIGGALCPTLTLRLEVLHALRGARRCCEEDRAPAPSGLSALERRQVARALARACVRAAWPLPARLAGGLSARARREASPVPARGAMLQRGAVLRRGAPPSGSRAELEARLVTAAAAVHRLSPHPVALAVALELLDVVTALEQPADPVEPRRRG